MNRLAELLNRPEITWWDVVDILLVSLLIYEALKLIRGTRAMQMAAGSVLVLVLFYMSQLFPLQTVAWLIRTVLVYVVFAVIVLFQSDIRRALSHLGSAPFFRYFARADFRLRQHAGCGSHFLDRLCRALGAREITEERRAAQM